MANQVFPKAREGFLGGQIDWDTAVIMASLARGYTYDAAHVTVQDFLDGGGVIVASQTLTGKTITNGEAGAADSAYPSIPAGPDITQILIYQASAATGGAILSPSSQRLIAFIDTATGLPATPTGETIYIRWFTGTYKIFLL